MKQSDYLNSVGRKAHATHKLTRDESLAKESFRRELEKVAQDALQSQYPDFDIENVRLKCYGSLANGFALAGCDMDLLLSLPSWSKEQQPATLSKQSDQQQEGASKNEDEELAFNMEVRRLLENAYLDKGYGARLLTNTRVPILRICQSPNATLLSNLRENRAAREESSFETPAAAASPSPADGTDSLQDVDAVEQALSDLKLASVLPRESTTRDNAGLEFTGDCGIQCDINFTNFVALHNSALLRLYHGFDQRVADIGIFVKIWAKTRDINTPYHGTLSSYGYILMVLHYLMNIASPPVIPNLQYLAKRADEWYPDKKIELFEGFDVRFLRDPKEIEEIRRDMSGPNKNHESAGQLLRGFFKYYATREGFHWTRDVISIRTKGGILSKQEKGWTEAKWAQKGDNNVRLRYLLAIEDPFEVDHNIARTVGHHGLVAIRDEFRRAWSIIERIGTGEAVPIDEFLQPVTDRADTLRKDLEFHRQKQKQLRQALEAKEKTLLDQAKTLGAEDPDAHTDGTSGTSDQANMLSGSSPQSHRGSPSSKLTSTNSSQDKNKRRTVKSWRHRRVQVDSDDEEDDTGDDPTSQETQNGRDRALDSEDDTSVTLGSQQKTTKPSQGLCSPSDVLLANGLDHWGNPVAWDIETQDGRWLHWRDNKIMSGQHLQFTNPTLRELDDQCPFDPNRPNPYIGKPYKNRFEQMKMQRPPWPNNSSLLSNRPVKEVTNDGIKLRRHCESPGSDESRPISNSLLSEDDSKLSHKDVVGEIIEWDKTTLGGRFLAYRDRRLRQGTWEHHRRSKFTGLDTDFPYNPEMTHEELAAKNELLRKFYKFTHHRELTSLDNHTPDAANPSACRDEARNLTPTVAQPTTAHSDVLSIQSNVVPGRSSPVSTHDQPVLAGPSGLQNERFLAHTFDQASDTDAEIRPISLVGESSIPNADYIRAQRLAFFAKHTSASESDAGTNSLFYQQSVNDEAEGMDHEPTQPAVQSYEPRSQLPAQELSETENVPLDNPNLVQDEVEDPGAPPSESVPVEEWSGFPPSAGMGLAPSKGPATPDPSGIPTEQPADEDTEILPDLQDFGFLLDARQLRDLNIIANGGNGCSREGAEFSIEEDYEQASGDLMDWKTGTSLECDGQSAESATVSYEPGHGDQDRLLDELPRDFE